MQKIIFPLLVGALLLGGVFHTTPTLVSTKAESSTTEYVTLGPAVRNTSSSTSAEQFVGSQYGIAYRGTQLMLYPSSDAYQGIAFNTNVTSDCLVDTDLTYVRIYTSKTEFQTLDTYYQKDTQIIRYNLFADAGLNVSFSLSLPVESLYAVTVAEGFVYPYAQGNFTRKLVQKETITYLNPKYGESGASDLFFITDWTKQKQISGATETIPIAAFSDDRDQGNYRLHIRGNPDAGNEENDNGSCYLLLFLGKDEYNTEINTNYNVQIPSTYFDVSDTPTSYLNMLYRKVHFTTMAGESLTLEQVSNPATKGLPFYNLWGERNCIAFLIGNQGGKIADTSYNALSFADITIERGAEFPSYQTTNGDGTSDVRYAQVDTVKLSIMGGTNWYWFTSGVASFDFSYGDTQIDGLLASRETITAENGNEEKTFIHLHTTTNNYTGLTSQALVTPSSDLTRYVYVNGRSLFYRPKITTLAYVNLNGRENTLSLSVDDLTPEEITEIIVQKGCEIPAATSSSVAREIYGSMAYYTAAKSVSYEGSNGNFSPSASLVWTVYFDGGFPVRVANSKYLDIDAIRPHEREKQTFKTWVDANGEQVSGNIQIDSGKEFFSKWITLCDVTLVNEGSTQVKRLQQYQRLTSFDDIYASLYPSKEGYRFLGWYRDDGTRFPIDNKIVGDITLTARWEAVPGYKPPSSLSTTDIVWICVLSVSVAGIVTFGVLFFVKRKKKTHE